MFILTAQKAKLLYSQEIQQQAFVVLQMRRYGEEARQSGAAAARWFKCENLRIDKVKM